MIHRLTARLAAAGRALGPLAAIGRSRLAILIGVALALTLVAIFRIPLLVAAHDWLDVGQPPVKTDYVYPLLGAFEERFFAAALLIKVGYADKGLIDNYVDEEVRNQVPPEEIAAGIFDHFGVGPDRRETLETEVANTYDEMVALKRFLQDKPGVTVTVVTSATHTRRTRLAARAVLGRDFERARFYSAPIISYERQRWWRYGRGFWAVTGEYASLCGYGFLYTWTPYGWLAVFAVLAATYGGYRVWRRRRQLA